MTDIARTVVLSEIRCHVGQKAQDPNFYVMSSTLGESSVAFKEASYQKIGAPWTAVMEISPHFSENIGLVVVRSELRAYEGPITGFKHDWIYYLSEEPIGDVLLGLREDVFVELGRAKRLGMVIT